MNQESNIQTDFSLLSTDDLILQMQEQFAVCDKAHMDLIAVELSKRSVYPFNYLDSEQSSTFLNLMKETHQADSIHFAVNATLDNKNMLLILEGLRERGMSPQEAYVLLSHLPDYFTRKYEQAQDHFMTGVMLSLCGIGLFVLPVGLNTSTAVHVLVFSLMITGMAKLVHGLVQKLKFRKYKAY